MFYVSIYGHSRYSFHSDLFLNALCLGILYDDQDVVCFPLNTEVGYHASSFTPKLEERVDEGLNVCNRNKDTM